jgi:acyl-CoA synthetase (AMP-forming)/AMP-acid ligase II
MIVVPDARIAAFTAQGWWGTTRIHDYMATAAARVPERLALVDPPDRAEITGGSPRRLTWAQVAAEVRGLAGGLAALGIRRDDILLVQLPNIVELPLIYLACFHLGAVVTPVPVQYREHELTHILQVTGARTMLTAARISRHDHAAMARGLGVRVLTIGPPAEGCRELHLAQGVPDAAASANDVATICWTSGTEAMPKGVPRSHNEWLAIPDTIVISGGLQDGCRLLNPFPLVNMAGISGLFLPWLLTAGRLVMHHPFDLSRFLGQVAAEEIDYTVVPPALLALLAQNDTLAAPLARLRSLGSGGGPLPGWAMTRLRERDGIEVINYFGSNEGASLVSCALDLPDTVQRAQYFPRYGVPGRNWALPIAQRMRTRLVDQASGADIDTPGVPGELRAWGPGVFAGYWNAPEQTARAFDEQGFYRSGDLFEIAGEEGQFYRFVGRLKDVIVRGGMNISAEEVENLLSDHAAVAEVAAIGVPDPVMGERLCAVLAPRGEAPNLAELCRYLRDEKHVAAFKLPERLEIVSALPRNPVGKVLKRELRERFGR